MDGFLKSEDVSPRGKTVQAWESIRDNSCNPCLNLRHCLPSPRGVQAALALVVRLRGVEIVE